MSSLPKDMQFAIRKWRECREATIYIFLGDIPDCLGNPRFIAFLSRARCRACVRNCANGKVSALAVINTHEYVANCCDVNDWSEEPYVFVGSVRYYLFAESRTGASPFRDGICDISYWKQQH